MGTMCCHSTLKEELMHKDIEHTKMYNAFAELVPKVQALITEHTKQYGLLYSAYAIRELAVELSGRHILTIPAVVSDEQRDQALDEFFQRAVGRAADLMEEAVENVRRKEK
jgi:hypothetical protein